MSDHGSEIRPRRSWRIPVTGLLLLLFTCLGFALGLVVGPGSSVRDGLKGLLGRHSTATSLVRVRTSIKSLLDNKVSDEIESKPFEKAQETLVKSMLVIQGALEEPKIAALNTIREQTSDAARWLQDQLKVEFAGEIMRISLSGERGGDLVEIVNAVTDSYLNKIGNLDRVRVQAEIETLETLQAKYSEQLRVKREKLNLLNKVIGSNDQEPLTLKQRLILQQEADLIKELVWAGSERQKVQIEYDLKRGQAQEYTARPMPEELASLGQKLAFYTQYEKVLKDRVESQSGEAQDTGETTTQLLALQDEISRLQQVHDKIGAKLEQLRVDEKNTSQRIELIEKAIKAK